MSKLPDNPRQPLDEKRRQQARQFMQYSGMAMQMGIIIVVGVFAGQKLDAYFQTAPYLLVGMALFSIFAALYTSLKDIL